MTRSSHGAALPPPTAVDQLPLTVLEPPRRRRPLGLVELWAHHELLFFLAQRDVKLRYRQTLLGAAWALLQPLLTMVIFTLVFGRLADVESDGAPYALFALAALVPWTYFSAGLTTTSLSLVTNVNLVSKVYFPRLAVPVAATLAGLVDLSIGIALLVPVAIVSGVTVLPRLLLLPFLVVLAFAAVLGPGLFLAAFNVRYRDVRYVVPFLVQTLLFVSPVAYATSAIDTPLRYVYALNPMVGVIEGFRWAVTGTDPQLGPLLLISTVSACALTWAGLRYYRAREATFADVI